MITPPITNTGGDDPDDPIGKWLRRLAVGVCIVALADLTVLFFVIITMLWSKL